MTTPTPLEDLTAIWHGGAGCTDAFKRLRTVLSSIPAKDAEIERLEQSLAVCIVEITNCDDQVRMRDEALTDQDAAIEDLHQHLNAALKTIEEQAAEIRALIGLLDGLKLEAQMHAQEARTANSTVYEIYQVVSGSTGEPGNWHGAEPVKEAFESLKAKVTELENITKGVDWATWHDALEILCALESHQAKVAELEASAKMATRYDLTLNDAVNQLVASRASEARMGERYAMAMADEEMRRQMSSLPTPSDGGTE